MTRAIDLQADRPLKPKRHSSAITSGRRRFIEGSGNSAWARRYADLVAGHISDHGGADLLSDAEVAIIKRAAALEVELEAMEGKLSIGEPVDLDLFQRASNSLRRLLESVGLKRVAKPIMSHWERMQLLRQEQADAEIVPPQGATP